MEGVFAHLIASIRLHSGGSPETQLFPLGSDAFCLLNFIIQIENEVINESLFRFALKFFPRDLQDCFKLAP